MPNEKQEFHVHHHYAPRVAPARARPKKKKKSSNKKVISVAINIIEEIVRLL